MGLTKVTKISKNARTPDSPRQNSFLTLFTSFLLTLICDGTIHHTKTNNKITDSFPQQHRHNWIFQRNKKSTAGEQPAALSERLVLENIAVFPDSKFHILKLDFLELPAADGDNVPIRQRDL